MRFKSNKQAVVPLRLVVQVLPQVLLISWLILVVALTCATVEIQAARLTWWGCCSRESSSRHLIGVTL
jgi:hypothetical protein